MRKLTKIETLKRVKWLRKKILIEAHKIPEGSVGAIVAKEMLVEICKLLDFNNPPKRYSVPSFVHYESGGIVGPGKRSKFYKDKLRRLKQKEAENVIRDTLPEGNCDQPTGD